MKIRPVGSLVSGLCLLLLTTLLTGCGGKSPAVVYYSLASIEKIAPETQTDPHLDVALGVGPVTVPEYLKKAQIATRYGTTRYKFSDFHRWAGMIEQDIVRVIGNNLGFLLGTEQIVIFPGTQAFKPDYRVAVEVIQFDSDLSGEALLSVRWSISDASGKRLLASGKSDYRQALANPGYEALVDAESLLLGDFSKTLAAELRGLSSQR